MSQQYNYDYVRSSSNKPLQQQQQHQQSQLQPSNSNIMASDIVLINAINTAGSRLAPNNIKIVSFLRFLE